VEVDQESVWQKVREWPSASLAELAIRIHNNLHTRSEHSLRRAQAEHPEQKRPSYHADHDRPAPHIGQL
jgi:hypothetical protein